MSTSFESDPSADGWTNTGAGACWTNGEAVSGSHSLYALTDNWSSPFLDTVPLQWYRLSFVSKAPGTVTNIGSIGYGYWSALFYDTNGVELKDDQYSSIYQSSGWVTNEFRIRAKHKVGPGASLVAARLQVSFRPIGSQPLYIDDVLISTTTMEEVAQWADTMYDQIPAKLDYVPKATRWEHIPITMQKLRDGDTLRIVMLGDSVQQDTANSPVDAFLERAYPGAQVEFISSTKGGTGIQYYKDHVAEFATDYKPDLLVIGGISNEDNTNYFQSVVDQVRAYDVTNGSTTEIMILTRAWSPNNNYGNYFLSPTMTELDPVPSNNLVVPDDYRGHLLNLTHNNNIEYLDMTGVASEFIYGPATPAGVGAPTNSNGDPYSYWMRDWVHSNDHGKHILGRELEIFFAPAPELVMDRVDTNTMVLSWPVFGTGYAVEYADALSTSITWTATATTPAVTNGRRTVVLDISGGAPHRFYRLKRP